MNLYEAAGPGAACQQPDCTGTIEDDGYCGRCGVRPDAAAAAAASGAAPSAAAAAGAAGAAAAGGTTAAGATMAAGTTAAAGATAAGTPGPPGTAGTGPGGVARVSVPVPRSRGTTGSRPSAGRTGRRRMGAGLVELPPVPVRDPATAVLDNPQVDEGKRFCSSGRHPVGRGRDGRAGRTEGFCPVDGTQYSFTPKLERGEMVGGQYEVVGCLAYGGQGWIYLARDHHLDKDWVVLKGLLDTGDAAAQAAAIAERRFLVEAKHPAIVGVYNFVQHADRRTQTTAGYIVMEYVGGQSLKQMVVERRQDKRGSLPLEQALTYAAEVLTALGYLHGKGLLYCDFKPDNTMLAEDHLKLIDMGAVRRIDDVTSDIYGTPGYQAPEITLDGALPSPSSDLYTVGRTLAVVTFGFGFTREYLHSLPPQETVPLLAEQDSYYRLLRRATDRDPLRRFTTAAEMAEQLTGVLREVLSVADNTQRPSLSTLFSPELQAIGAAEAGDPDGAGPRPVTVPAADILAGLPAPLVDSDDPAAGYLATLSGLDAPAQVADLAAVTAGRPGTPPGVADSVEVRLALARARIMTGDLGAAGADLASLVGTGRADWRVTWYRGLIRLAGGRPDQARAEFEAVYDTLPGELAPRLAVALAAEAAGDRAAAARHFRVVWTIDHSYVSAAFGLARVRLADGDTDGAIKVLGTVPETSSHYVAAQIAAFRARIFGRPAADLTLAGLTEAEEQLQRLRLDAASKEALTAEILRAALSWVAAGKAPAGGRLLGRELTDRALRFGLEQSYRSQARLVSADDRRIQLVDLANHVRPWTRS